MLALMLELVFLFIDVVYVGVTVYVVVADLFAGFDIFVAWRWRCWRGPA